LTGRGSKVLLKVAAAAFGALMATLVTDRPVPSGVTYRSSASVMHCYQRN